MDTRLIFLLCFVKPEQQQRELKVESRDLRTEAFMYNRLRQEYLEKAKENHRRGMSAVGNNTKKNNQA